MGSTGSSEPSRFKLGVAASWGFGEDMNVQSVYVLTGMVYRGKRASPGVGRRAPLTGRLAGAGDAGRCTRQCEQAFQGDRTAADRTRQRVALVDPVDCSIEGDEIVASLL
jgi:hypothetical protein